MEHGAHAHMDEALHRLLSGIHFKDGLIRPGGWF